MNKKHLIGILITAILIFSIVTTAFKTPKQLNLCGIMIKNNLVSYSQDSGCTCPDGFKKVMIWLKPTCHQGMPCALWFRPFYTCKKLEINKDLCNLNMNVCENVCDGLWIKRCTMDEPPSVCEEVCMIEL